MWLINILTAPFRCSHDWDSLTLGRRQCRKCGKREILYQDKRPRLTWR